MNIYVFCWHPSFIFFLLCSNLLLSGCSLLLYGHLAQHVEPKICFFFFSLLETKLSFSLCQERFSSRELNYFYSALKPFFQTLPPSGYLPIYILVMTVTFLSVSFFSVVQWNFWFLLIHLCFSNSSYFFFNNVFMILVSYLSAKFSNSLPRSQVSGVSFT